MPQNIIIAGQNYSDVPSLLIPKVGGGNAEFFDRSGSLDYMGIEAELVSTVHTLTTTLDNTDYGDWTPSTTAGVCVASEEKTAFAIDLAHYEYLLKWMFTAQIAYDAGTTMKAAPTIQVCELLQAIFKRPSNLANIVIPNDNGNVCATAMTAPLIRYWTSKGADSLAYSASYGFYMSAVAAAFSNSTSDTPNLTVKTPSISAKCNSSYFSTASANAVDEANTSLTMVGKLYRVRKGSSPIYMVFREIVEKYNSL